MRNVKMIFSYNGLDFNGWHGDPNLVTCRYIKDAIQNALKVLFKSEIDVFCAGRTDSGVHGIGQVCSFKIPETDLYKLSKVMEYHAKIGVNSLEYVDDNFHARFSAKQRRYMYLISNSNSPLLRNRVFCSKYMLDVSIMSKVCDFIITQKDMKFFAPKSYQGNTLKHLDYFYIQSGSLFGFPCIEIHVASKSFLHHQIRNMVGCLYEVGRGMWTFDDFLQRFDTQDRSNCGMMMSAYGLYFLEAIY